MMRSTQRPFQVLFWSGWALLLSVALLLTQAEAANWYKAAIHQHSLWSDGNAFPEEAAAQYKDQGYHFVATSDHRILPQGERWVSVVDLRKRCGRNYEKLVQTCKKRFGADWIQTKGVGEKQMVKLKTFEEISERLNEPGRFLYGWALESDRKINGKHLHMNFINLANPIDAPQAEGEMGTIIGNASAQVEMAKRQAEEIGRPILTQINHPNWLKYDISAENIAGTRGLNFLEVLNVSGGCNVIGDGKHPSCEKLWDIANTIRIQEMKQSPLFGTATDDCHHYLDSNPRTSQPGRGCVMVRSEKLEANVLVEAMQRGDFYMSTGTMLKDVSFDPATKTLRVEVDPKENTNYTVEFIGTRRGVSTKPTQASPDGYSSKIGEVFKKVDGTCAEYRMTGDELYVRAAVRSDRKCYRAPPRHTELQTEQAFTQPVGWK